MTAPGTDDDLLDRARAGDREALEALLERHQAAVYRFGLKMCRDPEDGKDVLQDTLLAAARGVRDFRGASSLSTWLYTIARSFCIKKRRKSRFAPAEQHSLDDATSEASEVATSARPPDEQLLGKQVERALEDAIASLDPMYREVLLLRDVEGLTAPEVARVVGASVQAVKSRLHRARLSVREYLTPVLGLGGATSVDSGSCPDVVSLFSEHLDGEISPELCRQMEQHLEGCGRCRDTCDSLKRTLSLCRTSGPATDVPVGVQAKVKGALREFLAGGVPD